MDFTALPTELLNEPFASEDNGYRAEIIVPRSRWFFDGSGQIGSVDIGEDTMLTFEIEDDYGLQKSTSNVSILTVFDTYGLSIALLFLDYLRSKASHHEKLLMMYIRGSMDALGISRSTKFEWIDGRLKRIEEHLTLLWEKQPLPLDPEIENQISLPLELIAIIVDSLRISKQVSELVRVRRASIVPMFDLIDGRSRAFRCSSKWKHPAIFRAGGQMATGHHYFCSIEEDGEVFHLQAQKKCGKIADAEGEPSASRSLFSYHAYYVSRGCDPRLGMKSVLDRLEAQVYSMSHDELAAWTVQLLTDMKKETDYQELEEMGMRSLIKRLINKCRSGDFRAKYHRG